MITKHVAIELIRRMPDEATLPDILLELCVRHRSDDEPREPDREPAAAAADDGPWMPRWLD